MDRNRFRIVQGGIPVAWTEGSRAQEEIMHYAYIYSQDSPVKIQKYEKGKWRPWPNPQHKQ